MWAIGVKPVLPVFTAAARKRVAVPLYLKDPFDAESIRQKRHIPDQSASYDGAKKRAVDPGDDDPVRAVDEVEEEFKAITLQTVDRVVRQADQAAMDAAVGLYDDEDPNEVKSKDLVSEYDKMTDAGYTMTKKEKEDQMYCSMELDNPVFTEIMCDVDMLHEAYTEEVKQDCLKRTGIPYEEAIRSGTDSSTRIVKGDLILREYISNLQYFKIMKFGPQLEVIRTFTAALLSQMFGRTWAEHRERVLERYGYDDCKKEILVTMPRRCGKSAIASLLEANALVTLGGPSAIFAPHLFQSQEFAKLVKVWICQMPNGDKMMVVDNQKKVKVSRTFNKDEVCELGGAGEMYVFSGSVNSARGFTAKRVYFDEASFASDDFITSHVFAAMLLADVSVLLISSPPDNSNAVFNQLCHFKNKQGEPVFKWIAVENMCPKCQQDRKIKCPHKILAIPPWQSGSEERTTIEEVLGQLDPRRYRIEILGVSEGTDVSAFPRELVDNFQNMPEMKFTQNPQFIGIAVDPSAEGESETGIVAAAIDDSGNYVVRLVTALAAASETVLETASESLYPFRQYSAALPYGSMRAQ